MRDAVIASPSQLASAREAAVRHQEELDRDTKFLTVRDLAGRWGCSRTTVRAIPVTDLPYLNLGQGLERELRRYRPSDVEAYECLKLERAKMERAG